jgi:hypothetical protein
MSEERLHLLRGQMVEDHDRTNDAAHVVLRLYSAINRHNDWPC